MSYRQVPDGWLEFSEAFIDGVKLGVYAGWEHLPADGFGEMLVYTPEHGEPQAWLMRRDRILGSPVPVVERHE